MNDKEQPPSPSASKQLVVATGSGAPGFCVFSVPVRAVRKTDPEFLTLLAVRARDGEVIVPASTTAWSEHLAKSRAAPTISRSLATVGRFFEYVQRVWEGGELDTDSLTGLIFAYIAFRAGEAMPGDPDVEAIKGWKIVTREIAWQEYRTLAAYFARSGAADIKVELPGAPKPSAALFHSTSRQRDFFAHLAPQRERWRRLAGNADGPRLEGPPIRPLPIKKPTGSQDLMEPEEIRALWRGETNPYYRALWCLLAGGGLRVSEALNLWACDVMPGSWSRRFTDFDQGPLGAPFVILAEPSQSTFIGGVRTDVTRAAYLLDRWNMRPRSILPKGHPLRAGWKGMTLTNADRRLSWIYWIDLEIADAFAEAAADIRALHRRAGCEARHPYFFVIGGRDPWNGTPLKYGRVAKAFDRAALRVGLDRGRAHRNLHGFRHYYIWYMREILKLSPEIRQLMLHHHNVESQQKYALKSSDVYRALSGLYEGRKG